MLKEKKLQILHDDHGACHMPVRSKNKVESKLKL